MDELYFESGYLEASYFGTLAVASSGVSFTAGVSAQGDIASTTGYYIPDYIEVDYFFAFVSASAAITSSFASSFAVNKTVNVDAVFTAAFTQTAIITNLEGTDLFAFSNAAISVQVSRIRNNNIAASAVFSVATDVSRIGNTLAGIIDNRVRDQSSTLTSAFAFTATISHIEGADIVAFANGTITANAIKNTVGQSAITGVFTQSTSAVKTAVASSSISSENNLNVINYRLKFASANLSSQGSTLTVITELQGLIANISSRFFTAHIYIDDDYLASGYYEQFETTAQKTASGSAALQSVATLTVGITASVFAALTTTSQASVTATVVKTVTVSITQASASSVSAAVRKTARGVASPTAVFTVFCNAVTAGEINLVAFANA